MTASSDFLASLIVASVGLAARAPELIDEALYNDIWIFKAQYREIDRNLVNDELVKTDEHAARFIRILDAYSPESTIIATSYQGHPIAFFCRCAQSGVPLTTVIYKASSSYVSALQESGMEMVHLRSLTPRQIVRKLLEAQKRGRYLVMIVDAPAGAGRRSEFLGYKVQASRLIELIGGCRRSKILPVFTHITAQAVSYDWHPIVPFGHGVTRLLLAKLTQSIIRRPSQYRWRSDSILLTDSEARARAVPFLEPALRFRNRMFGTAP